MQKQQLTVCLSNRRGALAQLTRLLKAGRINIEALSVTETADLGLIRLVVDRPAVAVRALAKAKIACTVQPVAMVTMKDRPGVLAALTAKLAKAGIDIQYVYGSACTCGCECESRIVISASDLKKVHTLAP